MKKCILAMAIAHACTYEIKAPDIYKDALIKDGKPKFPRKKISKKARRSN